MTMDLEYFATNGRISQREAESLHGHLCTLSGVTDADEIIADWNRRSPESPWGNDGESEYIHSFTTMFQAFMKEKINDAKLKK